ncbi:BtrH N-terminal domain-containing protein [Paenibacillus amylolyticus]|nr:BtrH N-terminal domain-containing protein [Paenibacillus amylolyticus]WFR64506.1 BtrH N-terminal domain-containing protein [Paenibacillus amylolyticus]
MNIQPREAHTEGEDCFTLCVSSILNYKEITNFLAVWKQCGMMYHEDPERGTPKLVPTYMTVEKEFQRIHHIDLNIVRTNERTEVIQEIMTLLQQNEAVIVWVDVFYMKYNSLYQLLHSSHCIVLSDYADGQFEFIDDFYHLKGNMDEQTLFEALDLGQTPLIREGTRYRYATLDVGNAVEQVKESEFYDMLHQNHEIMDGKSGQLTKQVEWYELVNPHVGLPAIERYIDATRQHMQDSSALTEEYLDNMYGDLAGISNNRYLYGHFLREGIPYNPDISQLVETYEYAAQRWNLAANMTLKSQYLDLDRRHHMLDRVLGKIGEIITLEQEAHDLVKNLVAS